MTFSLLARDEKTGALVAAAATGSLCVGGWVIRGALESGLVASQGTAPSTLWRDAVLTDMGAGATAETAVALAVGADTGRDFRQLAALDLRGRGAAHTGAKSVPVAGQRIGAGVVVSGNMLSDGAVLDTLLDAWLAGSDDLPTRALEALRAADGAGGDARGLTSAAMLVLHPDAPPLDLRIDRSEAPLADLAALLQAARSSPYADWLTVVPVKSDPMRAPKPKADAAE